MAKNNIAKPYQIFVSHATADKWLAVTLCEKLEKAGASTFRDDRDIDGGDDIPERIRVEIKRSRELVVLLTPDSVNRPWVLLEVGAAWGWSKAIRITPILCHVDVDPIPRSDQIKEGHSHKRLCKLVPRSKETGEKAQWLKESLPLTFLFRIVTETQRSRQTLLVFCARMT